MAPAAAPHRADPEVALALRGLRKCFGARQVLDGLDLEVRAGEFFGLVGLNGAGKTTTLKLLLDFCAADAGEASLFGVPCREPASRRRLFYLPERFLPPYYLRGRDFLRLMARLHGAPRTDLEVRTAPADLDLDVDALDRPVRTYSKGMAQKLGLMACFLADRDLVVLDEPMTGLDPKARLLVKRRLARLRETGRTVFFSTHLLGDVEALCDRMAVLHGGRLRFVGSPAACVEHHGGATLEEAYLACISEAPRPPVERGAAGDATI